MREKLIELLESVPHPQRLYPDLYVDHLVANGVTIQKWIPVSERLPEDMMDRVLVTTDCDTPVGNQRIDTDRYKHGRWVRYGDNVTHWMPLPEPPKGE